MVTREELLQAGLIIRNGGLVAFPTETVYGLGANALDEKAVKRVFVAKRRPESSPLIVHVSGVAMARSVVAEWPSSADRLASAFWPGPLTLVLPKRAHIPDSVTAGLRTVGVRVPAHPVAQALIKAAGVPIAAPSANLFTELSPTTADHVKARLSSGFDLLLEGGPSEVGIESTVLSLADPRHPALLRLGEVTIEQLQAILGPVTVGTTPEGAHASPGMHPKHYSPLTPLMADTGKWPEGRSAYLWHSNSKPASREIKMPKEARGYAAQLYSALHLLDAEGWDYIIVEAVPSGSEWDAVRDRLARAAAKLRA